MIVIKVIAMMMKMLCVLFFDGRLTCSVLKIWHYDAVVYYMYGML